jgi:hypothetical protein
VRELNSRLECCQTQEAEQAVQDLIDKENHRWATIQQTDEG